MTQQRANALNNTIPLLQTAVSTSELPTPSTQRHEIRFDLIEVYEALRKLRIDIDNLHPHLLIKMCALMIHEPVTCLYNNIMKTQVLPQESGKFTK